MRYKNLAGNALEGFESIWLQGCRSSFVSRLWRVRIISTNWKCGKIQLNFKNFIVAVDRRSANSTSYSVFDICWNFFDFWLAQFVRVHCLRCWYRWVIVFALILAIFLFLFCSLLQCFINAQCFTNACFKKSEGKISQDCRALRYKFRM